jgi:hypothetical protein
MSVGAWHASRCLTFQEAFVNLVTEMEARNIAQRYVICLAVLNSVTVPLQRVENFSRPLKMIQCQERKPFSATICLLKAEPLLKMSKWRHSKVRENVGSDRRLTVRIVTGEVNINRETVDLIWLKNWDENNLCQDGVEESHRETAGCAVERSFLYPNALRWYCSLLNHLMLRILCILKS